MVGIVAVNTKLVKCRSSVDEDQIVLKPKSHIPTVGEQQRIKSDICSVSEVNQPISIQSRDPLGPIIDLMSTKPNPKKKPIQLSLCDSNVADLFHKIPAVAKATIEKSFNKFEGSVTSIRKDELMQDAAIILSNPSKSQVIHISHVLSNIPESQVDKISQLLFLNCEILAKKLSNVPGLNPLQPQVTLYFFIGIDMNCFPEFKGDEMKFCKRLIAEESVYVLPGTAFNYRKGVIRLTLALPEKITAKACDRIKAFCDRHYKRLSN